MGGSHIVIKRQLPDDRAYMFQNADGRVVFAIPYEEEYLLIGTDNDHALLEETPRSRKKKSNIYAMLLRTFSRNRYA